MARRKYIKRTSYGPITGEKHVRWIVRDSNGFKLGTITPAIDGNGFEVTSAVYNVADELQSCAWGCRKPSWKAAQAVFQGRG